MARMIRHLVVAAMVAACIVSATPTTPFVSQTKSLPWSYAVRDDNTNTITVTTTRPNAHGQHEVARGQYNRSNVDLGWDFLRVEGNGDYYSGYLEGYLTADMIIVQGIPAALAGTSPVGQWVNSHVSYLKQKSQSLREVDKFWRRIAEQLEFLEGMADGLNAAKPGTNATFMSMFLINFGAELGDVQTHVQVMQGKAPKLNQQWKPSHCSALIKVTDTDLYMAHDTWDSFTGMAYRIYKVYQFSGLPTITFSAHPAFISSVDDWYQTSNQLAIQETTNGVMNTSLFKAVVPQSVSEFLRVMTATFLSNGGEEWTLYFARENSGTYNNQYMVVDFKLWTPGSNVIANTLWIAEQLPGIVVRGDESATLASTGYWASYNIPFFPEIYKLSGYAEDLAIFGDFYSYTKYARPEIFKRNQSDIHDLAGIMKMMRYNNWQNDVYSTIHNCTGAPNNKCETPRTAMLSIASRGDLMPVYPTQQENINHYGPLTFFMAQGCFGAIDSKIAAWSQRETLTSWVISGPTNDQQPTFSWNTGACAGTLAPPQTPTTVDYPWVQFEIMKQL